MKNTLMLSLLGVSMLALPSIAQAQEVEATVSPAVRVEAGVAIPLGDPQDDRFSPGGSVAVKPELVIADFFGVGPSASVAVFNSEVLGIDSPAVWALGGFIRFKRPHSFKGNTDSGAAAGSPWVDGDLQYVRTGPLDRVGYAAAIGVSWPVDEDRIVWMGPFVRYQGVHQADDMPVGKNTNDFHSLIFGASIEFGAPQKRAAVPPVEEPVQPAPVPVVPPPAPTPPANKDVDMQLKQVIQFAYDSDKLDAVAVQQLDAVVAKINGAKSYKAIKIEGHASAEPPRSSSQAAYNDKLSQRRANSVLEYLAAHGVSRDKLSAVGFGSQVPVATNSTEDGRVQNRRAEFVVSFVIVQEVK